MRVLSLQGDLAFDGHCYMYRAVKRVLERACSTGARRGTLPPIQEWRRFDAADVQPGLFWCENLREARRQLMAVGESPKVAISSPAQCCGLRLRPERATGGARCCGGGRSTRSTGASAWPAWRTRFF